MTAGRLQATIQQYRRQLLAHERTASAALDFAHRQTLAAIEPQLDILYKAMSMKLQASQEIPLEWLYENERLKTITQLITNQIDHFGALSQMQVAQLQHYGVQLGQQAGMTLLNSTVPPGVNFSFGVPSQQAIYNMIGATQKGSPLHDLFAGFGEEAAQGAKNALITGVTLGYNPRQIAPMVQDALNISRNRALVIARDQLVDTYRGAIHETYRANDDVVDQWRWTCALSLRSCAACIAMDGTLHDISEDMDEHVCGRCTPVPVTKSWDDILSPLGIDTTGIEDTNPALDMQTGSEWFNGLDADKQRAILGNAKYEAFTKGDIGLHDLVGMSHDKEWGSSIYERSLKDAINKEPLAIFSKQPEPAVQEAPPVVEEKKPAPPSFPTQKALDKASLVQFGGSANQTFKTTINGNDYFVKTPSQTVRKQGMTIAETAAMRNTDEIAAYQIGKAFRLEDALVPIQQMRYNGQDVLVSPWLEGKPLAEYKGVKNLINALSPEDYTRMHAYEYLMQDGDRHLGNYFYDGEQLRLIDFGQALEDPSKLYIRDKLSRGLAYYRTDTSMDRATLTDFLSHKDEVLLVLEQSGVNAKAMQGFRDRLAVLEALSQASDLTEITWTTLSKAKAR